MNPAQKLLANLSIGGGGTVAAMWLEKVKISGAEFAGYATGLWMLTQIVLAIRNRNRRSQ